jgi:hypothetical protein
VLGARGVLVNLNSWLRITSKSILIENVNSTGIHFPALGNYLIEQNCPLLKI